MLNTSNGTTTVMRYAIHLIYKEVRSLASNIRALQVVVAPMIVEAPTTSMGLVLLAHAKCLSAEIYNWLILRLPDGLRHLTQHLAIRLTASIPD